MKYRWAGCWAGGPTARGTRSTSSPQRSLRGRPEDHNALHRLAPFQDETACKSVFSLAISEREITSPRTMLDTAYHLRQARQRQRQAVASSTSADRLRHSAESRQPWPPPESSAISPRRSRSCLSHKSRTATRACFGSWRTSCRRRAEIVRPVAGTTTELAFSHPRRRGSFPNGERRGQCRPMSCL
jgi:hypothetical protein